MNFRFVATGLLMLVLAAGFFIAMLDMAPKSTDPKELLRIVGMVSGVVGAIGALLVLFGLVGRRR